MSAPLRYVAGSGACAAGAHAQLALRVAEHARRAGFVVRAIVASRSCVRSPSRYLRLSDLRGRAWLIRVSNHRWQGRYDVPNLDLVSIDGVAGYEDACSFLDRAIGGGVQWRDPALGARMPKKRRRR